MVTAARTALNRWHGQAVYDSQILIDQFALYQASASLSPKTIRSRSSMLTTLARMCDLETATIADLRGFVARGDIAPATRRTYRNGIRAFYTWMQQDGLRDDNPADSLPRVRVPRSTPRPFTLEQVEAMMTSGAYRRTRAMIALGYYCGFRVSQIAAVRGDDINGDRIRTRAKGGVELVVPLHPVVAGLAGRMPAGWWFPARRGLPGHISSSGVTELIHKAVKRAGITDPRLTAHALRHSFCSHLVEQGVDIRVIAELAGHASVATTQIYTRVPDRMRRDAVDRLPAMVMPTHSGRAAA